MSAFFLIFLRHFLGDVVSVIKRILVLMAVAFSVTTVCFASDANFSTKASSRLMGKGRIFTLSPDQRHVAVIEEAVFKPKYHLVVSQFIYLAKKDNRWLLVNNQNEINLCDEIVLESLSYS